MNFFQRLNAVFKGDLVSKEVMEENVRKALDVRSQRLIESKGIERKARHVDPLRPITGNGGFGPAKRVGQLPGVLRAFARQNPWLRAAIDIRKREVAATQWEIVPYLKNYKKELEDLLRLVRSVNRYPDRKDILNDYKARYIPQKDVTSLIDVTTSDDISDSDVKYRFMLALQDRAREAEEHAEAPRRLFDNPNPDFTWADIRRAIIPDLLTLDSANLEKRRTMRPEDPETGRPMPGNKIVELHWVDGATIRPCIDEYGQLMGGKRDPDKVAYEQWINGVKVESFGYRSSDLLQIIENPQTDLNFLGHGYSRAESLIITSMLESHADASDLEEYKREMFGGFLNITDPAMQQEDMDAFSDYIAENYEATKRLPYTAFEKVEFVSASPNQGGRDKKQSDRLTRYVQRICAIFDMPEIKLGINESVGYNTAEASLDIDDAGLLTLLSIFDDAMTTIVQDFGHDDVAYSSNPEHSRDEEKRLENTKAKQEQGIWTVNDARVDWEMDPVEEGDKPLVYYNAYWEEKGRSDAQPEPSPEEGMEGEEGMGGEQEDEQGDELADDGSQGGRDDLDEVDDFDEVDEDEEVEKSIALQVVKAVVRWKRDNPYGIPDVEIKS